MDDVIKAREAYYEAFGNEGPYPHGVSDRDLAAALLEAAGKGQPIPATFNWYREIPDGAAA